jgi:hypothetical protein
MSIPTIPTLAVPRSTCPPILHLVTFTFFLAFVGLFMIGPAVMKLLLRLEGRRRRLTVKNEFRMPCGDALPERARGIAVWSRGEDGINGTDDDIRSWR